MQTIPPVRALLAVIALFLVLPTTAGAAVGWNAPATLAPGTAPEIAAHGDGRLTAVWRNGATIKAATKAPGAAAFGAPANVATDAASAPRLAVNAKGAAVVAYIDADGFAQASVRSGPAGAWTPTDDVSDSVGAGDPGVGIDSAGNATFVWVRGAVVEARRRAANGELGAVQVLQDSSATPRVAVAPGGQVAVVWLNHTTVGGLRWRFNAVKQGNGSAGLATGTPQEIVAILGDGGLGESYLARPSLAVNGNGDFVMGFWENDGPCDPSCTSSATVTATRTPAGDWGELEEQSPARNASMSHPTPDVAIDPNGNAFVVWSQALNQPDGHADESTILASGRAGLTGKWLPEQAVSAEAPEHEARDPQVAAGPKGRAVAAWYRNGRIEAAIAAPGFGAARVLSAPGASSPQVAWGEKSDAYAIWQRDGKIEIARYGPLATTSGNNNGGGSGNNGGGARPPAADTLRPILGGLSIGPRAFKARRGARIRYELSEAAAVSLRVERKAAGRRQGRRCARPARRNRAKRKCTRWVRVGSTAGATGRAGDNDIRFDGRVGGKRLKPGAYRLVLTATDAAGNRSSAARVSFRVKR